MKTITTYSLYFIMPMILSGCLSGASIRKIKDLGVKSSVSLERLDFKAGLPYVLSVNGRSGIVFPIMEAKKVVKTTTGQGFKVACEFEWFHDQIYILPDKPYLAPLTIPLGIIFTPIGWMENLNYYLAFGKERGIDRFHDRECRQGDLRIPEGKTREISEDETTLVEIVPLVEIPNEKVVLKSEAFWIEGKWLTHESVIFFFEDFLDSDSRRWGSIPDNEVTIVLYRTSFHIEAKEFTKVWNHPSFIRMRQQRLTENKRREELQRLQQANSRPEALEEARLRCTKYVYRMDLEIPSSKYDIARACMKRWNYGSRDHNECVQILTKCWDIL